jgi:hypothetical protein
VTTLERKQAVTIAKLKAELAKYKPARKSYSDPQTGHDWPLSSMEKSFVETMRRTEPRYKLPPKPRVEQHPAIKRWAEAPDPKLFNETGVSRTGWKPA